MSIANLIGESLAMKYAILKQEANAASQNAATNAITGAASAAATTRNAETAALAGAADVKLNNTRSALLPVESAASVKKIGAETGLIGQQAKYLGPETLARIAQMRAETGLTTTNDSIAKREGLMERSILPDSLQSVMGVRGYQGYRLPGW